MNEGMMEAPRGVCTEPPATCPSPGLEVLRGACVGGSPVGVPVSHRVRVHGMAEPQPSLGRGGGRRGSPEHPRRGSVCAPVTGSRSSSSPLLQQAAGGGSSGRSSPGSLLCALKPLCPDSECGARLLLQAPPLPSLALGASSTRPVALVPVYLSFCSSTIIQAR